MTRYYVQIPVFVSKNCVERTATPNRVLAIPVDANTIIEALAIAQKAIETLSHTHVSTAVFCTCGINDGPEYVPDPRLAWRHMANCPHSKVAS